MAVSWDDAVLAIAAPPLDNPFGPRLLPMSQVRSVDHVSGPYKLGLGWLIESPHRAGTLAAHDLTARKRLRWPRNRTELRVK